MYRLFFKRVIDFITASLLLVLLLPILILVAGCLFSTNRGKVFFVQKRPGRNANIFGVIKFRTMNDRKDSSGKLLSDRERLTFVGKIIRGSSIDELPQLINVLKGDMSLIGPRPLLERYLPLYNMKHARRHEVRPGITGWAQVNGRNAIKWCQKFEFDIWYIDNYDFLLDLKILWLTFVQVFKRDNINAKGSATMPPFDGYN